MSNLYLYLTHLSYSMQRVLLSSLSLLIPVLLLIMMFLCSAKTNRIGIQIFVSAWLHSSAAIFVKFKWIGTRIETNHPMTKHFSALRRLSSLPCTSHTRASLTGFLPYSANFSGENRPQTIYARRSEHITKLDNQLHITDSNSSTNWSWVYTYVVYPAWVAPLG